MTRKIAGLKPRPTALLIVLLLLGTITVGAFHSRRSSTVPTPLTDPLTRGDIVSTVAATDTLDAVTTVQVGGQISGTIESLGADFNSMVRKGQVLARLDRALYAAAGQVVTFRVDAYPTRTFTGKVLQVRLDATTVDNVVTYTGVIDASNPELLLKPGMTAAVTFETARRNMLRVPNSALRFKPDQAVLERFAANGSSPVPPSSGASHTIWVSDGTIIRPVSVTTGASDGVYTEVLSPSLSEGTPAVTRLSAPVSASASPTGASSSPLLPARR